MRWRRDFETYRANRSLFLSKFVILLKIYEIKKIRRILSQVLYLIIRILI